MLSSKICNWVGLVGNDASLLYTASAGVTLSWAGGSTAQKTPSESWLVCSACWLNSVVGQDLWFLSVWPLHGAVWTSHSMVSGSQKVPRDPESICDTFSALASKSQNVTSVTFCYTSKSLWPDWREGELDSITSYIISKEFVAIANQSTISIYLLNMMSTKMLF